MNNAYGPWYGESGANSRPPQRRPLPLRWTASRSASTSNTLGGLPEGHGGGDLAGTCAHLVVNFEMALMTGLDTTTPVTIARCRICEIRRAGDAVSGSCAWSARWDMFFHRLGPVPARRMLLTGDIIEAGAIEHLGDFTDTCDAESVPARARCWGRRRRRCWPTESSSPRKRSGCATSTSMSRNQSRCSGARTSTTVSAIL